jgi:hypothetical protein
MNSASWVCIGGYTFRMKLAAWLLLLGIIGAAAYTFWKWRNRWIARERASEERFASFIAQARPAQPAAAAAPSAEPPPARAASAQEKLLFEAAAKASEAGEPALSIQLYARMLARYPGSAFGALARAAVEAQKQKLAKP